MTSLSVIITTYDSEKTIEQTLGSVLAQGLGDLEIICIDRGSSDGTRAIAEGFAKRDGRVKFCRLDDASSGAALDRGLAMASGEYVHFMPSGDQCIDHGYEAVIAKARRFAPDCLRFCAIPCSCSVKETVADNVCMLDDLGAEDLLRPLSPERDDIALSIFGAPWASLYKREFLLRNNIRFGSPPSDDTQTSGAACDGERAFNAAVITNAEALMATKDRVAVHIIDADPNVSPECCESTLKAIEARMIEDGVSRPLFEKIMDAELRNLIGVCAAAGSDKNDREAAAYLIERICDEYAGKYSFMRGFRAEARRLKKELAGTASGSRGKTVRGKAKPVRRYFYESCEQPKLSVVVPVLNNESCLNAALSSLADQTLEEIEFICADRGSEDSSMAIVRQFAGHDRRFVVADISDNNSDGRRSPIDAGIGAARGEYIGFLRPEDHVSKDFYAGLYETAKKDGLDAVIEDICVFQIAENGSAQKERRRIAGDRAIYRRDICPRRDKEAFALPVSAWSGIYRRGLLNDCGIRFHESDEPVYLDSGFMFRLFSEAAKIRFSGGQGYMFRKEDTEEHAVSIEEAAAVSEGYERTLERLKKDPAVLKDTEHIFYDRKLADLLECWYRLDGASKRGQLHRIKEEFEDVTGQGMLDPESVNTKLLRGIVSDPDAFCDKIRVSVIMPVYNAEKYIRQCLDSFLAYDEIKSEVICVDDGSTDGTIDILREYEKNDPRVSVITQKNAGAGAARNNGMQYASGEYLLFLDSDDFFEPEMIRQAYLKAFAEECDIVIFGSDQLIESTREFKPNNTTIKRNLLPDSEPFRAEDIRDNVFGAFIGWPWDKLFRAEFIRESGLKFQEQRTTNDLLFVFSAIIRAESICTMSDVFAHHRRLDDGESLSVSREKSWDCFYKALCALRDQLREWGVYERYERDFINYSLNFSLWNLRTIKGKAYFSLFNKLKDEWFENLGVTGKDRDYFYSELFYRRFRDLMESDAEEFLFAMLKEAKQEAADSKKEANRQSREAGRLSGELRRAKNSLAKSEKAQKKAESRYAEVTASKAYKIGKKLNVFTKK